MKKTTLASRVKIDEPAQGVRFASVETGVPRAITLLGSFEAGYALSPENPMVPVVAAQMLHEGTRVRGKDEIQERLDALGASIDFSVDAKRFHFQAKFLKESAEEVISILAEELKSPSFPKERLKPVKDAIGAELKLESEHTKTQAIHLFLRTLYPEGHLHHPPGTEEKIAFLEKITASDLTRFHKEFFGGELVMGAAGDVPHGEVSALVKKYFDFWGAKKDACFETSVPPPQAMTVRKEIPSKASVDVVWGRATAITKDNKDFFPLFLAARILGNRGFTGRLMKVVREKLGLTYGIYTYLDSFSDRDAGFLYTWGTFAPELLEKGIQATSEELRKLYAKGATAKELKEHITTALGNYGVSLSTSRGFAMVLLTLLEERRDSSFLDEYPEYIRSVKLKDVNRIFKEYFDPKKNTVAMAGTFSKSS